MSNAVDIQVGDFDLVLKGESECLTNPAWASESKSVNVPCDNSLLDGKDIFLQTRRAVYSIVHVVRDAPNFLIVTYMKKDRKSHTYSKTSETIEKQDIDNYRVFTN
jgi:hypothetical protein